MVRLRLAAVFAATSAALAGGLASQEATTQDPAAAIRAWVRSDHTDEALRDFIARKKAAVPDLWY